MTARVLAVWPAQPPPQPPGGGGGGGSGSGIGDAVGGAVNSVAESAFDAAMQKVWDAGVWLLRGGFTVADAVTRIDTTSITDSGSGGGALWPSMMWLAAMIALGLFFYQLAAVAIRGGRGMFRAFTGPAQFGIAIAVTTGTIATLLAATDGITTMFLQSGLDAANFTNVVDSPDFASRIGENPDLGDLEDQVRPLILGLTAIIGVIPAGLGFALQMIFRQAAVLVLFASTPIVAAGLVADTTAAWFWKAMRWLLAAILMKPALALVLVIGVNVLANVKGVAGLLAGTAVLWVALFSPMVLYRLFAFVDPGTGAGMAVRSGGGSSSSPGSDGGSSEATNAARFADGAGGGGPGGEGLSGAGAGGGELGGTTAAPGAGAASGGAAGAGGASASGAGAGGAAAGGGAAGGGATTGGAAAAAGPAALAVGAVMVAKAAANASGDYGSSQMNQTGIGHPGPGVAPGPSGQQIRSAMSATAGSGSSTGPGGDESGSASSPGAGPDAPVNPGWEPGPPSPGPDSAGESPEVSGPPTRPIEPDSEEP